VTSHKRSSCLHNSIKGSIFLSLNYLNSSILSTVFTSLLPARKLLHDWLQVASRIILCLYNIMHKLATCSQLHLATWSARVVQALRDLFINLADVTGLSCNLQCSRSNFVLDDCKSSYTELPQDWISAYRSGKGDSVAEWLACWTQAQKALVQIAVATLSGNSLRQPIHTYCASVRQAAKLAAALLRVARVTAGLAESNGSLRRVYDSRHLQADCKEPGSAPEHYAR